MATIFAVRELLAAGKLKHLNVVFLYEGEEESSSVGFRDVVQRLHASGWLGGHGHVSTVTTLGDDTLRHGRSQNTKGSPVLGIIVSNNYWVSDDRPCLTYGMRGTIDFDVTVAGPRRELHSGVDGGTVVEPLVDLLAVLGGLVDARGMVLVPGFYRGVRERSAQEAAFFDAIKFDLAKYRQRLGVDALLDNSPREVLEKRWRQVSLLRCEVH